MPDQVIQYTGQAHTRTISKADFQGIGVTDQGDVEFIRDSPITKGQGRVSLAAAEYLVANDSFKVVEPAEVVLALSHAAASGTEDSSAASGADDETVADKPAKSKRG